MKLDRPHIDRLCELARLEIDPDQIPDMAGKLADIVAMVGQLGAADTRGVTPMAHPMDMAQRLRPDEVTEADDHERLQRNAAHVERDLYLVPKVIE